MSTMGKTVVWACMCSILFSGCYSSATTYATGSGKDKVDPGRIQAIVTKDGKRYEFDSEPSISNDAVVGKVGGRPIAIPMSDVRIYYGQKFNGQQTVLVVVAIGVVGLIVGLIVSSEVASGMGWGVGR